MDCIFCKIAAGEIPAAKIYEDDKFLGFLDINPCNKGHALIIPKEHFETTLEMPEELFKEMMGIVQATAKKVFGELNPDGFNILMNNYRASGQEVPHLHAHIMPRYESDDFKLGWSHKKYEDGELVELAEKLRD